MVSPISNMLFSKFSFKANGIKEDIKSTIPKNKLSILGLKYLSIPQSLAQVSESELIVDESVDIALARIAESNNPKKGDGIFSMIK